MKTGLKSMVAAAIAAFTFGFAPSAEAATISINTAQQRYPWNGQFDITYTASGIAEACGTTKIAKLKVWAVNPATQEEIVATEAALSGDTEMSDGTHSLVWDMDAQGILQGLVTDELTICVTALAEAKPKPLGGVQLWEGGPYFATNNVGATKPEEYGYYFWWGSTVGYKRQGSGWVSVETGKAVQFLPGSCPTHSKNASALEDLGYINSGSDKLNAGHDAATVSLEAPWRMMTEPELKNLVDTSCCTWKWTTDWAGTGIKGWIVTGAKGEYEKNSIFLPAAGTGYGSSLLNAGMKGCYWASTIDSNSTKSYSLDFNGTDVIEKSYDRYYGMPIRPVRSATSAGNGDPEVLCTGELDAAADLRTGTTRNAAATETLTYTTDYSTGGDSVTITVNGSTVLASGLTGSGTIPWTPDPNVVGEYSLQHIVYKSGSWLTTVAATFNSPKEELALKDAEGNTVDVKLNRSWAAEKTGTTDPTAQAEALNVKQDNGHRKWENEILGLNGSVSTSIPVISPVQTSNLGYVGFLLSGVNVDTTSGASVSNKVWWGSTPGGHDLGSSAIYPYEQSIDAPLPGSGVQYYNIEVLIK